MISYTNIGQIMINLPKTKEEALACWKRSYLGGYNDKCCVYPVPEGGKSVGFRQCSFKPGKGPGALYCAKHASVFEEKKSIGTWYRVSKYDFVVTKREIYGFTNDYVYSMKDGREKRFNEWYAWFPTLGAVEKFLRASLKDVEETFKRKERDIEKALEDWEKLL